jgi:glutaredoxin 3
MARVLMYSTRICPYCQMAERLLAKKGVTTLDKILVDDLPARREEMTRLTGRKTVPQIFIGETHVGGYTDLADLDRQGKLDSLLAQP